MTVPIRRVRIAENYGLQNAGVLAQVCSELIFPYAVGCALMEQESMGRNVYGHDAGGALSGFEKEVDASNFAVFRWMVMEKGQTSNGVGPSQITWAGPLRNGVRSGGFFKRMEERGLLPYDVHDNMFFGVELLQRHFERTLSWESAGRLYNGSTQYGIDLAEKIVAWRRRF